MEMESRNILQKQSDATMGFEFLHDSFLRDPLKGQEKSIRKDFAVGL